MRGGAFLGSGSVFEIFGERGFGKNLLFVFWGLGGFPLGCCNSWCCILRRWV